MNLNEVIFTHLIDNEGYGRKVIPFLKAAYFQSRTDQTLFTVIEKFVQKYNKFPSREAILIEVDQTDGLTEDEVKTLNATVMGLKTDITTNEDWLVEQTEKFCQDRALYNAIMKSIQIFDGKTKEDKGSIPELLSEALAISFDQNIGHDFLEDFAGRYDFYHSFVERIPFDIEIFNKITKGGIPKKTLSVALAGTGVGKSLFMCHLAASHLANGHDVLYITMEMAEERIAERIDANLLNINLDELELLPKDVYLKKIERVREKTKGKLIIKEYPTSSAGSANFRHLLNELKLKKSFIPKIIYIDYLNICMSSRIKQGANVNSYTYIKAIAEELRGLAVEFDVPIFTATQTTRSGYSSTDVGLEDTSESFGLPATADFMIALISTEELQEMNQLLVKQLKNRFSDPAKNRRFVVGIDRAKMKLYDVEQSAQQDIIKDAPAFDNTQSGARVKSERKFDKSVFDSFS